MKTLTAAQTLTATITAGETPLAFDYHGYRRNVERAEAIPFGKNGYGASDTECCAYCGKYSHSPKFHAFLDCMNEFVESAEVEGGEYLGFYPLGSDCARRLKKIIPVYGSESDNFPRVK